MKIVYCTMSMGVGGGVERILTSKINALVEAGHEVKVVITDFHGKTLIPAYRLNPTVEILHYPINFSSDFSYPIWKRAYNSIRRSWKYFKKLKRFLFEYRPDIVCTTQPLDTAFLPFIQDGSKKIVEYHISTSEYRLYRPVPKYHLKNALFYLYEWRDKLIASFFDVSIVLTQKDQKLRKYSNSVVIPNFSDLSTVSIQPKSGNKIILALGRFTEQKDFLSLINIWSQIAHKHSDWRLRIVGEGYLYESLCEQVMTLNLQKQVEILPHTNDVVSFYQDAAIYAMTSRFEGLPMVLLEAQIMGLPIISYDCPCGPSDIITNNVDGFLIPPGEQVLFAQKLDSLIANSDIRLSMGTQALESAERFAPNKVMSMWIKLFQSLTENGK